MVAFTPAFARSLANKASLCKTVWMFGELVICFGGIPARWLTDFPHNLRPGRLGGGRRDGPNGAGGKDG